MQPETRTEAADWPRHRRTKKGPGLRRRVFRRALNVPLSHTRTAWRRNATDDRSSGTENTSPLASPPPSITSAFPVTIERSVCFVFPGPAPVTRVARLRQEILAINRQEGAEGKPDTTTRCRPPQPLYAVATRAQFDHGPHRLPRVRGENARVGEIPGEKSSVDPVAESELGRDRHRPSNEDQETWAPEGYHPLPFGPHFPGGPGPSPLLQLGTGRRLRLSPIAGSYIVGRFLCFLCP